MNPKFPYIQEIHMQEKNLTVIKSIQEQVKELLFLSEKAFLTKELEKFVFWRNACDNAYADFSKQLEQTQNQEKVLTFFLEALSKGSFYAQSFGLTFLYEFTKENRYIEMLIKRLANDMGREEDFYVRYHVYSNMMYYCFANHSLFSMENRMNLDRIYAGIVTDIMREFDVKNLREIPASKRNPNFVIVTISQFRSEHHSPTLVALDRCATLMRKLGKSVLLLNLAELYSNEAAACLLPLYQPRLWNYNTDYLSLNEYVYQGLHIPFFQCENDMPNSLVIQTLLETIQSLKPAYIIGIGGSSPSMELFSKIVPTVTLATTNELAMTLGQLQILRKPLQGSDIEILKARGKMKDHVVVGRMTTSLLPQEKHVTKAELGLSETDFLCAVVGTRLEKEITEEFVEMILKIEQVEIKFIFIGNYEEPYRRLCENNPNFSKKTIYYGETSDLPSILEHCRLFVNPTRIGGGYGGGLCYG
ncbi:hypothetical protein FACS1894111_07500 [Clostridia bacterium]|nr:hypothetical protein FACS1894111_07500 [Clostridia bacterium]